MTHQLISKTFHQLLFSLSCQGSAVAVGGQVGLGFLTAACAPQFWVTLNSLFCLKYRITTRHQTIVLRNLDFTCKITFNST